MFQQGAVGEPKPLGGTILIDDVNDAAGVQRVEPEMMHGDRKVSSGLYRSTRPIQAHPGDIEHLPSGDRRDCPAPRNRAFSKLDSIVVHVVPTWEVTCRRADFQVREAGASLLDNKTPDLGFRWCRQTEQRVPYSLPDIRTS
jgi:hypothetical protein